MITIIVLLILAGVTIATLTGDNGILTQANRAKYESEKSQYKEQIEIEYASLKHSDGQTLKDTKEIFELLQGKLNFKDTTYWTGSKAMIITIKQKYIFTLLEDGTVLEGKFAYLSVEDGTIELYSNGYKQNEGEIQEYQGNYIITGTTKENTVKVMDTGTYNITIKDLNIDVSLMASQCAFNANRGARATDCFVNLTLEGENYLAGSGAPGLGFAYATPNVDGITNGSTLTIGGDGSLEAVGGAFSAGIGSGYTGWECASGDANNIIFNSGKITARTGTNGCAIGGALRRNVNNIIINGGDITANASNRRGIGTCSNQTGNYGILDNLVINGGNLTVNGGEYGGAIGGGEGSGEIRITGGVISATKNSSVYSAIGDNCNSVKIEGGTIICNNTKGIGIGSSEGTENIQITGGNIIISANTNFAIPPIDGENNVYLAEIQLENVVGQTKIDNLITSDNLNYAIKDMYTIERKLYLYLPEGGRTINVVAEGKTYTGEVETSTGDGSSVAILKEK